MVGVGVGFLTWFKFQLKWQKQYYSHKKSSVNSVSCTHIFLFFFFPIGKSHLLKTMGANEQYNFFLKAVLFIQNGPKQMHESCKHSWPVISTNVQEWAF